MSASPLTVVVKQVSFGGGLDAVTSPHLVAEDTVQAVNNVDFSLEWGALRARRGAVVVGHGAVTGTSTHGMNGPVALIARNYGQSTGVTTQSLIPYYAATQNGFIYDNFDFGQFFTIPVGSGAGTSTGGTALGLVPQYTIFGSNIFIANGTSAIRHSGPGVAYDWLLPQAETPTVSILPQWAAGPPFVGFAGTGPMWGAQEGIITASSTSTLFGAATPIVLATATTGTGTRIVLVGNVSNHNWENPIPFITPPTGTGVTVSAGTYTVGGLSDMHAGWPKGDTSGLNGTFVGTSTATQTMTIGVYGTDYIPLALLNQSSVVTVQVDLSIGDTSFTNYWHQETTPSQVADASVDPVAALIASQGNDIIGVQTDSLNQSRAFIPKATVQPGNTALAPPRKTIGKLTVSAQVSPWALARSGYGFIGAQSAPDFTNIQAVRVIIEYNTSGQTAVVGGVITYGGVGYPLSDNTSGISYFQTYAVVDNDNNIISEGAASLPSTPHTGQFSHAEIVVPPNTNTTAGITHRVIYRNGGLLQDAYRVGSVALFTDTTTIYDYAFPDLNIIRNPVLTRNLWSVWPDPSAGLGLSGANAVSQPWQERAWIGVRNQLYWTQPGVMSKIQNDSQTTVSEIGDPISAIIPGQNLVVVNQASVFEMAGSIFEGTAQNWTLTRTGARRGSVAPRTAINTPYGILLFGYDGLSFYRQGWGLDQEQSWIYERIGDLWKGTATDDPARQKGRIPPLNTGAIFNSVAAYKDERVYLAIPTGTATYANTMYVLHLGKQKVWQYTYPFNITSLFWDRTGNALLAGSDDGFIYLLETGSVDTFMNGLQPATQGIVWIANTREWSHPEDALLENLQIEALGNGTWQADVNNTNTYQLATFSSSVKEWAPASIQGSMGQNVNFILSGTASGQPEGVYELQWDSIPQPPRVTFFQIDPVAVNAENYIKTWLADLNTLFGTVTGSILVDGIVVMTSTFISPTPVITPNDVSRRYIFEVGLPNVTAGKNVTAVYNAATPFRHHDTKFELEAKPFGKRTWLVTYKKAGGVTQADMARFYAMDIEGLATNTITNTWLIDGAVFCTNTLVFGASDSGEEPGIVRNYLDQIPFPPGARGYLFQQQVTSDTPFRVWKANLDIDRIGIKGLSRVTQVGTPQEQ